MKTAIIKASFCRSDSSVVTYAQAKEISTVKDAINTLWDDYWLEHGGTLEVLGFFLAIHPPMATPPAVEAPKEPTEYHPD
jgi:hypothetical protein